MNILKEKGHPIYRSLLRDFAGAEAESDTCCWFASSPNRGRDIHLLIAGLPIFSQAWWKGRDFESTMLEAPLGSGPYKVSRFEQGRYIEFERVPNYWAANLPVNIGQNNFDRIRYDYFRERQIAFEAFKSGQMNFQEEFTARFWATGYDFPAVRDGRVQRVELPSGGAVGTQGWIYNTRRSKFSDPRIREALNHAFDFEWTNRNIMYSAYSRLTSYFENSDMKAQGKPGPEELALLEPFRGQVPEEVFAEPWVPPVSDGSGSDRALLRRANDLLMAAGCKRDGARLRLPDGSLFEIEFLDSQGALQAPHRAVPGESSAARNRVAVSSGRRRAIQAADRQFRLRHHHDGAGRLAHARRRAEEHLYIAGGEDARLAQSRRHLIARHRRDRGEDRPREDPRGAQRSPRAFSTGCCARAATGYRCGTRTAR